MRSRESTPPTRRLFVGGLDFDITRDAFVKFFAAAGDVAQSYLAMDNSGDPEKKNLNRGFGFIEYRTQEEADNAIGRFNGVQGPNQSSRKIGVQYSTK